MSIFKACVSGRSKRASVMYSTRDSMIQSPSTTAEDPNMYTLNEQYATGDQTEDNRIAFWNSGFTACIKCGQQDIRSVDQRAGVRQNGETYGTEIFKCQNEGCGWQTSFEYDDASEEFLHYEAMGWERGISKFPVNYMVLWAEKNKLPASAIQKIKDEKITGGKLIQMDKEGTLDKNLGVNSKLKKKIHNLLTDKFGALLT